MNSNITVGTFRHAIRFTAIQQIPIFLLSAMFLDGGLIFKRVVIGTVAFWVLTMIIMIRRGSKIPDSDILFVKWGYLPVLFITFIMWAVGKAILNPSA